MKRLLILYLSASMSPSQSLLLPKLKFQRRTIHEADYPRFKSLNNQFIGLCLPAVEDEIAELIPTEPNDDGPIEGEHFDLIITMGTAL